MRGNDFTGIAGEYWHNPTCVGERMVSVWPDRVQWKMEYIYQVREPG